ncbi:MAG: methyltransferase [Caulobacteraceae bacterium]|nr:methyltransferase [Caulobacteraceae bacterium]
MGRRGGFMVEGEVVLAKVVAGGRHALESLLLDEKRVVGLQPILDGLAPSVPVYTAPQAVLDAIVGFHIHRGILAVGRRAPAPSAADLLAGLPDRALALVLFGIGNHDNMGGLFRNAAAFGAGAVLLGPDCCDPLYRKAIRVSVGAALTTPFAWFQPGDDPIALLRAEGFEPLALSPAGSEPLHRLARPARAALILGAEGPGLPPAILARARTVAIPMAGGFDSLNVAVTSGIVLHHLAIAAP